MNQTTLFPELLTVADDDSDNWFSPPWLIDAAREVLGGRIDLDPATSPAAQALIQAARHYTKINDGLSQRWQGRIWLNPPYSEPLPWIKKLLAARRAGDVPAALILTNAANSPRWAQLLWKGADAVCLFDRRLRFWHPSKEASSYDRDNMLAYFGPDVDTFYRAFAPHGVIVSRLEPQARPRMSQSMQLMTSNASDEWYTPPWVLELARQVLGGIDLDPASSAVAQETVQAARWHSQTDDGLSQRWQGRIWLNPPFSATARWAQRLATAYQEGDVSAALLLVNSAPGYNWYEELVDRWPAVQLRKRLAFVRGDGQKAGLAKKSQTVFYFGPDAAQFFQVFREAGRALRGSWENIS